MKKVRMNLGGQSVEAEMMVFKAIEEPWSLYKLDDGTTLKVKIVLSDVYKIPIPDPLTGLPQFIIRASNVLSVDVADQPSKKEIH
jgi:hypothetical protein